MAFSSSTVETSEPLVSQLQVFISSNMTSLEITSLSVLGFNSLYHLETSLYPMNEYFSQFSSNFSPCYDGVWARTIHPNTPKELTLVFIHALNGILFTTIFVRDLLRTLTVVWTASSQSLLGSLFAFNVVLAISTIVLFIQSTTPFCWGVQRTVSSLLIPCSWQ